MSFGPPPKRSDARVRRNKDVVEVETLDIAKLIQHDVEIPVADEKWTKVAKSYYESFTRSAQTIYFEPSDWMTLYFLCDQISRHTGYVTVQTGYDEDGRPEFDSQKVPMPGAALNAILKGLGELLATEGTRRKLRLELSRSNPVEASAPADGAGATVTQIRKGLLGGKTG